MFGEELNLHTWYQTVFVLTDAISAATRRVLTSFSVFSTSVYHVTHKSVTEINEKTRFNNTHARSPNTPERQLTHQIVAFRFVLFVQSAHQFSDPHKTHNLNYI